ncbi:MAG: zinc-dependent metalloprotease [Flavobacteriaceae bacterium]|nr:zinc-dependent metalloprotease [Flavobacteriaceae bacterium]
MRKLIFPLILIIIIQNSYSQFFNDKKEVAKYEGFVNFYYNENEDKIYLEVDKLDTEFLYVHALSEGIGSNDIGIDRGQLGNGVIVKFQKAGNKLLLIQPNQDYRALTNNEEERKSIEEAFAKSVLYGFIIKEQKNNKYLIDVTDFLIRDAHGVANRLERSKQGSYSVDKTRSAFNLERIKAFPKNVEFDVILTFKGKPKDYNIKSVTPDANSLTVNQHHSFVKLPDDNYKPRTYDPRSGTYPMSYMDYATPVNESIVKRFIYRHRLEKRDPNESVSEAVKPIIYYLDRGAPEPVRSALLEGASWWNQAFESIGYKNAFQVKMLPEGVDPLDLRYNVIQWVHRSTRGWSYGGSISDPRTGEILKGHVSLGSLRIRQDFLIAQALQAPYANNDSDDQFALEMALARIRQLSAHEVGHTLGFTHNFAASTNSRSSVMDYPHPKLQVKNNKIDFSNAYDVGIGEWDKVTVAYAYRDFQNNEEQNLQNILNNAFDKGMRYISDADARPKGSAHAYAHLWDNGNNIIDELGNVLEVREFSIKNFSEDNIKSNQPYSVLEDVFVPLYFYHRYQTEAVSKMIGGLDYAYSVKGSKNNKMKKIDRKTQKKALTTLMKTVDVKTLAIPNSVLELFSPRAIGYPRSQESFKSNLGASFDPYGAVATASNMTFELILHPQRVTRVYMNKSMDKDQLGLNEMFETLNQNTFKRSHKDAYHQELQNIINEQLLNSLFDLVANENLYPQVKALSLDELNKLSNWLSMNKASNQQKIINDYYVKLINDFIKDPKKKSNKNVPKIPNGSPIGME